MRRRKRTWIVIISVACALSMLVAMNILIATSIRTSVELGKSHRMGDLVVSVRGGKWFNSSFRYLIAGLDDVVGSVGFIRYYANFQMNGEIINIEVYGCPKDPQIDTIPNFNWDMFEGMVAVVDSGTAQKLGLRIGDIINVLNTSFRIIEVRDILWAPSLKYGFSGSVVVPLETLQRILEVGDTFNEIRVKVLERNLIPKVVYEIVELAHKYGYDIDVKVRGDLIGIVIMAIYPIYTLALLLTSIIVASIMLGFIVIEIRTRTREIGILRALGLSIKAVVLTLMLETTLIFLFGMIIGTLLGITEAHLLMEFSVLSPKAEVFLTVDFFGLIKDLSTIFLVTIITTLIVVWFIIRTGIVRSIREREYTISGSGFAFKMGDIRIRFALRSIITRRYRSIAILFIVVISSILPTVFSVIAREGIGHYKENIDKENLWDIAVQSDMPLNRSIIENISALNGVSYCEAILMVPIPVTKIKGTKKTAKPPYSTLGVLGLNGNETLMRIRFKKGELSVRGIVISEKIAKCLGVGIGGTIEIEFIHPLGTVIRSQESVTGIVETSLSGGWLIVISLKRVKEILGRQIINFVMIKKDPNTSEWDLARAINSILIKNRISAKILSKEKLMVQIDDSFKAVNQFIIIIDLVITLGAWLGMLLIWVFDIYLRRWYISLLKVLGATLKDVGILFAIEALIISIIGIIAAGPLLVFIANIVADILNSSTLPVWVIIHVNIWDFVFLTARILITPLIAQLPAVIHTFKQSPAEILQSDE